MRFFAIISAVALAGAAHADVTAVYDADGNPMTIEVRGDDVRMSMGDENYMILKDGRAYSVMGSGGDTVVLDIAGMMEALRASPMGAMIERQMGQATPDYDADDVSFDRTGRKETIAGVEGEVVIVTTPEERIEVVVTDDKAVKEAFDGMIALSSAMVGSMPGASRQSMTSMIDASLKAIDGGMLRSGDEMRLTRIDRGSPSASRFELPAEPRTVPPGMEMMMGGPR